ncbi:hypothetical protein CMV_020189 [Castanea mollissima]|uniref:Exostosin GT47 domain-containing protein n=1 Tax=Castanea mollissima TaxID=60419 RepID=A0A8J4QR41_9ROSI|nr:hypothetical protein CMV_020189 [Castanea mollissima]
MHMIRSHAEMLKRFKVWPYKEGELPIFHRGPMTNIYSTEGQFMDELESGESPFLAKDPNEATAFYIPVSITNIIEFVYKPRIIYTRKPLQKVVKDYMEVISKKHPYWNRSDGADHFMVSCHDWGPKISFDDRKFYKHFIRVLCNANTTEGFDPARDASLPEVKIASGNLNPPSFSQPLNNRSILAFFAGGEHGFVRKILLRYWKDNDPDIQVHEYLPKNLNYFELMGQSKFCLCPSGYEVASPRVVESIFAECVPVLISDGYVPPFSDVLDWSQFSIQIPVAKIPEIKKILQGISEDEFLEKRKRVIQVHRHFVINRPAKPYDLLHMVMHSVWLRRLNIRLPLYNASIN